MIVRLCASTSQVKSRTQRMFVIASFQKCPSDGMVRVRTGLVGRIGSEVRVGASFQKNARLDRGWVRVRTPPRGSGRVRSTG